MALNTPGEKPRFNEAQLAKVEEIKSRYPQGRQKSALLPLLHMAQDTFGWCSVEVMDYVAELLEIKPVEVYEVATFYTMFNVTPVGKIMLEICHTGPCMLRGSDRIIAYVKNKLGIEIGETTPDGIFTLKTAECLAACGYAPMMQVGEKYYEFLTEEKIDALLDDFRALAATLPAHIAGTTFGGSGAVLGGGRGH